MTDPVTWSFTTSSTRPRSPAPARCGTPATVPARPPPSPTTPTPSNWAPGSSPAQRLRHRRHLLQGRPTPAPHRQPWSADGTPLAPGHLHHRVRLRLADDDASPTRWRSAPTPRTSSPTTCRTATTRWTAATSAGWPTQSYPLTATARTARRPNHGWSSPTSTIRAPGGPTPTVARWHTATTRPICCRNASKPSQGALPAKPSTWQLKVKAVLLQPATHKVSVHLSAPLPRPGSRSRPRTSRPHVRVWSWVHRRLDEKTTDHNPHRRPPAPAGGHRRDRFPTDEQCQCRDPVLQVRPFPRPTA